VGALLLLLACSPQPLPSPKGRPTSPSLPSSGALYAIDGRTGRIEWRLGTGLNLNEVIFANGFLYTAEVLSATVPAVRAVDAATGKTVWLRELPGNDLPGYIFTPVVAGELVLVRSAGGILALEAATGTVKWRFSRDDVLEGPVIQSGVAYVAALNRGEVLALDTNTGRPIWTLETEGVIVGPLRLGPGSLLVLVHDGRLLSIDPLDGSARWEAVIDDEVIESLTAANDELALVLGRPRLEPGLAEMALHAIDVRSGLERWEALRFGFADHYVTPGEAVVLAVGSDERNVPGFLYALDAQSGRELWRTTRASVPARIAGSLAFVAGPDEDQSESFASLDARTGTELWAIPYEGTAFAEPALDGDACTWEPIRGRPAR
jgi:outer membrane protein assembly factor BamB